MRFFPTSEMVTTRMTLALPITSPRAVRNARTLLARSASMLDRSASRWNIRTCSAAGSRSGADFSQQSLSFLARWIVWCERRVEIFLEQLARLVQVALRFHINVGTFEHDLGIVRR